MQTTPQSADPAHVLVEQARLLNQTERPKQALPLLLQAFALTPDDDQVLCHLSYTYSKLQDNKNALRFAEQAIAQKPDNEWAHRLRGHVFWVKNHFKEAMRCAREAQKADPDEPQGWRLEADLWLAQRKYKEARSAAETMRKLAPSDAQPFVLLARAEMGLASQSGLKHGPPHRREAEAFARQALALAPDLPDAHTVLGEALNAQQKTRDALDAFFQASRLDPTAKHVQQNLHSTLFTRFFTLPLFVLTLVIMPVQLLLHRWAGLVGACLGGALIAAVCAGFVFLQFAPEIARRQKSFRALPDYQRQTYLGLFQARRKENARSAAIIAALVSVVPTLIILKSQSTRPSAPPQRLPILQKFEPPKVPLPPLAPSLQTGDKN